MVKVMKLSSLVQLVELKRTKSKFVFNGEELEQLFHSYNNMGLTERSVEIPIIKYYLKSATWKHVLEIGNVTNYYESDLIGIFPNKTVVDKNERNYNVITSDIAQFESMHPFDFIFSISTFEHMDSDLGRNSEFRSGGARYETVAADNIIYCYEELLEPGGLMVIIAPLGYTTEWDQTFKGEVLDRYCFDSLRRHLVRRVSEQRWIQQDKIDFTTEYPYGRPFPYANYVSILEIRKHVTQE